MKHKANLLFFLKKHHKALYYIIPILTIIILSFTSDFFSIDKRVINRYALWDMSGRPYETFLYELNLPNTVGAIFVGGTPENPVKIDETYEKINTGDIFTSQIRSLFGKKITAFSISAYINFTFGIFAVAFSLLSGYLVFRNGYISIVIFMVIVLFRNFAPGLIYGLPLRHEYAVFNPLIASCIMIFIIIFFKKNTKRYWILFILSGFAIAYITHIRPSEGQIVIFSLVLFSGILSLEQSWVIKKNHKKLLVNISIMLVAIYSGYFGYQKMIAAFEYHRDIKLNLPVSENISISKHPPFHTLYTSLFRYGVPNKYGDKIGYDAVYERYPDIQRKFSSDINYTELANSEEYNQAVKELYFDFIFNHPKRFLIYLARGTYDYILFLPYYSWTGNKSAHAYLPKINESVEIETQDLAPDFKDTSFNWILNLKLKYLPKDAAFWIYFIAAYSLLINAIYVSFVKCWKGKEDAAENNLPIYLLRGMLIYFFFASVVRILIPVHGQSAVVAFNIIVIYNMVRLVSSMGQIKVKKIEIPAWAILLGISLLFLPTYKTLNAFVVTNKLNILENGNFDGATNEWIALNSVLTSVSCEHSGNCLKITTSEDNDGGIAYARVPAKVGEMYKIIAYFKSGTSHDGQIKVGTSVGDTSLYYSGIIFGDKWMKYSGVFRASAPFIYITLVNATSTKGLTSYFDSVSVVKYEYYSE